MNMCVVISIRSQYVAPIVLCRAELVCVVCQCVYIAYVPI